MPTVTIFGSSLPSENTPAYLEARQLGRAVAECGLTICNGGYGGLMEASARGAREAGGHTVGVTCSIWSRRVNPWILDEVRTTSFPERIMTLIARGDAYVVLPGGTGTLAELALAWEMMNKSVLSATVGGRKPLVIVGSYWQPVIDCLDREPGLVSPTPGRHLEAMKLVSVVSGARETAELLASRLARQPASP